MVKICKNCGWENTSEAVTCEKCCIPFDNVETKGICSINESRLTNSEIIHSSFMWKIRKGVYLYALLSLTLVFISTITLYSYYGPLTPNGNRYHHSFDISTVPVWMVILSLLAMFTLLYPIFRYYYSNSPANHKYGIFPSSLSILSKVTSISLTILNIFTGFIFTTSFLLIAISYILSDNRVMADDLETIMLAFAYCCCILFWGLVNLIYILKYKKDW